MAFVYRYITARANGKVKYVGLVKGDRLEDLKRRISQHRHEPDFSGKKFYIEYIEGLTITEAELLESHFIAQHIDTCFNKAKRNFGAIRFDIGFNFEWKAYDESNLRTKMDIGEFKMRAPHKYYCCFCGKSCKFSTKAFLDLKSHGNYGSIHSYAAYFCNECKSKWVDPAVETMLAALPPKNCVISFPCEEETCLNL